jgi:hypothetical protein
MSSSPLPPSSPTGTAEWPPTSITPHPAYAAPTYAVYPPVPTPRGHQLRLRLFLVAGAAVVAGATSAGVLAVTGGHAQPASPATTATHTRTVAAVADPAGVGTPGLD